MFSRMFSFFRASNSNIVFTIPRWIQIISANDLKSSFCSVSEGSLEALSHSYSEVIFIRRKKSLFSYSLFNQIFSDYIIIWEILCDLQADDKTTDNF